MNEGKKLVVHFSNVTKLALSFLMQIRNTPPALPFGTIKNARVVQ